MSKLERLRPDHRAAVLAFERENRAYFAGSVSDRGDEFFTGFDARFAQLLAEQDDGRNLFHVLVDERGDVFGRFNLYGLAGGTATVGYRVAQHVAGRGVATAAVRELCAIATGLGLHTLTAATSDGNVASQKVLLKAGFVPDGPAGPDELGGVHGTRHRWSAGATPTAGEDDGSVDAFASWERDAWEIRAQAYAVSLGDLTAGSIPALLDAVGTGAGVRLLDVGTGPGFVAIAAAERGAVVRAVDQSHAMVAIARADGVDAYVGGAAALPFDDPAFDAVVAGCLLNHLPRPEAAVRELARVLRPGGRLAMTIWDVPAANPAIGTIGEVVAGMGMTASVPDGPDPYRYADEPTARDLLAAWDDVSVRRLRWAVPVSPAAWFDAIADGTPRTGAVLAQAPPPTRDEARRRYAERVTARYAGVDGRVLLPAGAVLLTARRR